MAYEHQDFPKWGYREGEARVFEDGPLPKGWVDHPDKIKTKGKADDAEAPATEAGE